MIHRISVNRWNNAPKCHKKIEGGLKYFIFYDRVKGPAFERVELCAVETSPLKGVQHHFKPWEGNLSKKPWEYDVTAVIPTLGTPETLSLCIELLRLQSVRPFIIICDTGSKGEDLFFTENLVAPDVEVHSIRLHGVRHPSDYPAMAMDVAFALCRTEYLFATHADVFLRRQNFLEDLVELCKTKSPVVGYQLSPRNHKDWKGMVSHTATMFHMPTMDRIGFGWNLRRLCNQYGLVDYSPTPSRPNWPDTEILGNYLLRKHGIQPHLIGEEDNNERTLDDNIDHVRSFTSLKLYGGLNYKKACEIFNKKAKVEALERIKSWKSLAKN